jgi:hypothetical protein
MSDIQQLGKHHTLSNCVLTRVDLEAEHHYFVDNTYFLSVTRVLDIGGPFPEALRQYLRSTDAAESVERMEMTMARGSKLHRALEELYLGWEVQLADYPTQYEKEAIVSFIRVMRFLTPKEWRTELVVADPVRRLAGTMDLWCVADKRKLDMLLEPTKYLDRYPDEFVVKERYKDMLKGRKKLVSVVIDYKFTGRNTYNHKAQVAAYKHMFNLSYAGKLKKATHAYTWRYSAMHKNRFDMQESHLPFRSFSRIFETCLDYLGSFPEPPEMNVYPDAVRLFNPKRKEVDYNNESP